MYITMNKEEKSIKEKKNLTPLKDLNNYKTEMEKDIVQDYKNGLGVHDITKKHDISMGLVYTVLNTYKVPKRRNKSSVSKRVKHITDNPETLKQLINDYQFMSNKDIYSKYNLHKNGLYYILDLYKIERKTDAKETILEGNKYLVTE